LAVTVKAVAAEPAGIVTEVAGTGRSSSLLVSETAAPPAGAGLFKVTVQLAFSPLVKLVGVQTTELGSTGANRVMEAA
jgi:hypothetical protein